MDVARYGDYATLAYTNAKVQENYRRRFRITFPNEELPDGRPLLTTPIYDRLTAANAVWGATYGLEHALWFQEDGLAPVEDVTFRRSNAWKQVAAEVAAVREQVGMTEISNYAKYRVTGPGAEAWLSSMLTQRMPASWADRLDRHAQRRGPDRRRVHDRARERDRRVPPLRVAPRGGPPLALVPPPPAARRKRPVRGPGAGPDRPVGHGPPVAGAPVAHLRPRPVVRGVPVHDVPAGRSRDGPGARRPDQLQRRPGLRAVGRAAVPAPAVRRDRRGRPGPRPAAVRDAGADVAAPGEELRDVVPRVPADLHGARGGSRALRQARPRVHRAGRLRGRTRRRRADAPARHVRRGAGPGRSRRRHRRRTDLARRRRSSAGSPAAGTGITWGDRSRSGTCLPRWRRRTAPAATASRSRSSADGGRRGSSPSRCSTRRACGCASDRRLGGPWPRGPRPGASVSGRIVVDGRPIDAQEGDSARGRDRAGRRAARAWRDAVPRRRLRELPGGRRWHRLRPDVPGPGASGDAWSSGTRPRGTRRCRAGRSSARSRSSAGRRRSWSSVGATRPAGRRRRTRGALVLDAAEGNEVVAVYPGPTVVARTPTGMLHVETEEIVVATGAAEIQPVCPGNDLDGLLTPRAADQLRAAGVVSAGTGRDGRPRARPVRGRRGRSGHDGRHDGRIHRGADRHRRSRPGAAGPARADGRADPAGLDRWRRGRRPPAPGRAHRPDRGRLPVHGRDRRRPRRSLVEGVHEPGAAEARAPSPASAPARAAPACPMSARGSPPGPARSRTRSRPGRRRARSPSPRPPRTRRSTPSGGRRSTTSTSRWAPGWTGSAAGGGRGTTATPSPSTGRSARASRSAT